jgi:micrococcal nuclease
VGEFNTPPHTKEIKMKKFILIVAVLLGISAALLQNSLDSISVKRIYDGDTITIEKDGLKVKIRLDEVDCPEKDQPYGIEARDFVEKFLEGKFIVVKITKKDKYGRSLGSVKADNDDLEEALVKNGYAWVYRKYSKNQKLISLEDEAKKSKIGLWKDNNPIPPWEWRKTHK